MRYIVCLFGFGLMVVGGFCAFDGLMAHTENIMQQIAQRIEFYQGISVFAFGLLAVAIANVDSACRHAAKSNRDLIEKMNAITIQPEMVLASCEHCGATVEFDASGLKPGEATAVKCLNCKVVTEVVKPAAT